MKVIIVGTAYPFRGGLAAFNERLAQEFVHQGYDVELYTFTLQYPSFLFPGKTQFSNESAPMGLKIYRKINSINPLNWIRVGREIKRKNPDKVVFCYWMSFMAPCFASIARFTKGKNYALVHNMMPHEPSLLDKLFPRFFVSQMDGFVAMAEAVRSDIDLLDKKNVPKIVSPHPVYDRYGEVMPREKALEALELDTSYRYILFFGFIRKYKGLDLLLGAFGDERLKKLPVKLIVAGEFYESSEPYQAIIEKHEMQDRVLLHSEFIADDAVKLYFNGVDLVAQTYRTATQSGVSQIAYNFEKPMLVTDVGGLGETVPHGKVGYVVNPDASSIAEALVDYFSENRAEEFTKNVRIEKKKYAWSSMVDAFEKLTSNEHEREH